jgi:hypothetical protein
MGLIKKELKVRFAINLCMELRDSKRCVVVVA